jgi:hypothetical protein
VQLNLGRRRFVEWKSLVAVSLFAASLRSFCLWNQYTANCEMLQTWRPKRVFLLSLLVVDEKENN